MAGFAVLAVAAFLYAPDFLAVRGLCVLVLLAAEMVGAKAGLGYLIIYAQYSFLIGDMYFGIIAITFIGVVLNYVLQTLERRLTAWKPVSVRA